MVSVHPVHEGTISAPPFGEGQSGRISGSPGHDRHGGVEGARCGGRMCDQAAEQADSPESSAAAELNGLISSLSSLSSQAQSLPLSPPPAPSLPQGGYKPQVTDYSQLGGDAN